MKNIPKLDTAAKILVYSGAYEKIEHCAGLCRALYESLDDLEV